MSQFTANSINTLSLLIERGLPTDRLLAAFTLPEVVSYNEEERCAYLRTGKECVIELLFSAVENPLSYFGTTDKISFELTARADVDALKIIPPRAVLTYDPQARTPQAISFCIIAERRIETHFYVDILHNGEHLETVKMRLKAFAPRPAFR